MRMVRVYSETPLAADSEVSLRGEAARHVTKVLRMRTGDKLVLFDGSGLDYAGTISSADKNSVTAELTQAHEALTESGISTTLWHGICRSGRMDYVVQKATELGVSAIQPVFTTRGVVKLEQKRITKRVEHWQKITISAAEQSGRSVLPEIREPLTLQDAFTRAATSHPCLMLDPEGTAGFDTISGADSLTILTGPEGGFTDDERRMAEEAGFSLVRLGPRVLRSETAPVAALTVVQYLAGDMGSDPNIS